VFHITRILFIALAFGLTSAACSVEAPETSETIPVESSGYTRLSVGITGQNKLTGLDDPITVIRKEPVSHLLQDLADAPRDSDFIQDKLNQSDVDLDHLLSLGLIRKDAGKTYVLNFPYFTIEDHDLLIEKTSPYASALTQIYVERWAEFQSLFEAYDVEGVTDAQLAYALLGAFSLDWDGLDITANGNYRTTADNMPQTFEFIPWAKETVHEDSLKGLYWGSHNRTVNGIRFTTFGDHAALPRTGLPDHLWQINRRIRTTEGWKNGLARKTQRALSPYYQDPFLKDAGQVLIAIRRGDRLARDISATTGLPSGQLASILDYLVSLNYLAWDGNTYQLRVPVFAAEDREMVQAARTLSNNIIIDHLANEYDNLKDDLSGLTMIEYGTPYEHLCTQIWHYLFGMTNRKLMEQGLFPDLYDDGRDFPGFTSFVFSADLMDLASDER